MNCYTSTKTNQPSTINTKQPTHEPSPPIHLYTAAKGTMEHFHVVIINKKSGQKGLIQQFHQKGLSDSTTHPRWCYVKRLLCAAWLCGDSLRPCGGAVKETVTHAALSPVEYTCRGTTPTVLSWGRPQRQSQQRQQAETFNFVLWSGTVFNLGILLDVKRASQSELWFQLNFTSVHRFGGNPRSSYHLNVVKDCDDSLTAAYFHFHPGNKEDSTDSCHCSKWLTDDLPKGDWFWLVQFISTP